MRTQEKPGNSSYQSLSEDAPSKERGQNPVSRRQDQGGRPQNVVRDGNKTYEAFADEYDDQGP